MARAQLADLLQDFGARPHAPARLSAAPSSGAAAPAQDIDAILREAVAAAEAELALRLAGEHEAALAQAQQRHAAELDALQAGFAAQAAERIAGEMSRVEERVTELTLAATARILSQLMGDALKERSLAALGDVIRRALRDDDAVRIEVRGPRSIYEPLLAALGDRAAQLHYEETSGFDLTVAIGERLFETRLGEWAGLVGETLA